MFILFVFQHVVLGYKLNKKKHFSEISNQFLFISIADCLPMVLNCRASHRQDKGREGRGGGVEEAGGAGFNPPGPSAIRIKKTFTRHLTFTIRNVPRNVVTHVSN